MERGAQGGHPIAGQLFRKREAGKHCTHGAGWAEFQHTLQEDLRNLTNSTLYFLFIEESLIIIGSPKE